MASIRRLSLSVEPDNFALSLYRAEGFVEVTSAPDSVTLVNDLDPTR